MIHQSKKPKTSRGIRHALKFCLFTDVSRALIHSWPWVNAERSIHLSCYNGWGEFWPEPMKFLVDMLNHTHWLRIMYNVFPREDRYDSLRICVGEEMVQKLANLKLFMVGCGAIGCEMMKNYALLGIASALNGKVRNYATIRQNLPALLIRNGCVYVKWMV